VYVYVNCCSNIKHINNKEPTLHVVQTQHKYIMSSLYSTRYVLCLTVNTL